MTFAYGTLISIPGSNQMAIETIKVGDKVLASSVSHAGSEEISIDWSKASVGLSTGVGPQKQPMIFYLVVGESQQLICDMEQPFLLADGTLIKASNLQPGQQLVSFDGQPVTVNLVSIGSFDGGLHTIATDVPWIGSPNGHWLLANGVVAGDYLLQLNSEMG